MSSIGTGYDLSASQFSPEGKVFQIEYAFKAVENSGTAIAIQGKDGVVFAVENIVLSKLYEPGCIKRVYNVDNHIGMVIAGLQADARALVEVARDECSNYRADYGESIPLYAYHGCAIGKAKQNAKTEIEKLKSSEMPIRQLIKEAAKIIHTVHDEIKDKHFELNLSWVGAETNGIHEPVPDDVFQEAEAYAKQALEEVDDLDEDLD